MNVGGWMVPGAYSRDAWTGGNDKYGNPIFSGAPAAEDGRVQPKIQIVMDAYGKERKSTHTIYTETAVGDQDRFWLAGDSTADLTKARKPIMVVTEVQKDGTTSYYKVLL